MIKLFGLTVTDSNGIVWPSNNSKTLLESQDFPLFFKSFCNKFQFPNCINVWQEAARQVELGIKLKPASFILEVFKLAEQRYPNQIFYVSGNEISNYVFNDLRVARSERSPKDVLDVIEKARENNIILPGGSNLAQHGREFLRYMTLANLLKTDEAGSNFCLNKDEGKSIDHIIKNKSYLKIPNGLENSETRHEVLLEWDKKFKTITQEEVNVYRRKLSSIRIDAEDTVVVSEKGATELKPSQQSMAETGDEGELYVLKHEKELVGSVRPDKLGLVARVSNDTSLGYDIQSLELPNCDKKKYIEVKSTIRTFPPSDEILTFFPMSGNEWETARHYQDSYYIYRVVLLADEVKTYIVKNPAAKHSENKIILDVKEYRVVLKHEAVDDVYFIER